MCGVAGIFNRDGEPASAVLLKRMTDAIAHRGPDGEGHFVDDCLALGHRRLSIIDLTPAGHQPMQSPDGRFVISYNGEIYNFQELRAELQSLGHRFQSRSDTEVLLHALAQWGLHVIPRLNGMFAFALWDHRNRELLLVRDRYGIKPLYYVEIGSTFLFSSEIKAFLHHPAYSCEMDRAALLEYLTFQNFFTDRTLFRHVHLLQPGCTLRVGSAGEPLHPQRYWDYRFSDHPEPAKAEAYVDELNCLFQRAVNRQLVSDVAVGCYLSGGMDSGSITAVAARQMPNLKSFTVGFDLSSASGIEMGFDERAKAEHMSYCFKTEHYEMVLKAGDMERAMTRLVWHLEEPRVGQSYPNFYAAQLASKFGKVVLSGAGGDELFGGYPWRYYRAAVNSDFEQYVDRYYDFWQRLIPNDSVRGVFQPIWADIKALNTRDIFRDVLNGSRMQLGRPEDYINSSLYFEAKTFLHGLLVMEDKLSMAHSVETRVPFLDNDLADFAMNLPVRMKLGNLGEVMRMNENDPGRKRQTYFAKTRDGKLILRQAMRRFIPAEVVKHGKQGFSAPDASWFRGESIDYVRATLFNRNADIYDFLDRSAVRDLVSDHLEGRENRRLLIWSLLYLEQWCHTFLRRQSGRAMPTN